MNKLTAQTNNTALASQAELEAAFDRYDQAAARFVQTRKAASTRALYARQLAQYRAHCQSLDLDPLGGDALIAYNTQLNERRRDQGGDLANDTIRNKLKAVASLFSWCYTFGLIPIRPEQVSQLIALPPAKKLSPRDVLTGDEARRLLAAAEHSRDRCLLRAMLDAGLRLTEALGLRAGDIYAAEDRHFITVVAAKGDDPRDVPISAGLYEELSAYARARGWDLLDPGDGSRLLFGNLYPRAVQRMVATTAQRAGLQKKVTPHALRHTLGHQLSLLGLPLEIIGQILGHKNYDTTKIYTRPAQMVTGMRAPELPWALS